MPRSRLQQGFKNGFPDSRGYKVSQCGGLLGVKKLLAGLIMGLALPLVLAAASKPLQVYFIDVEGGQSTLFVSPSGQSMLVDTGWPDHDGRDAKHIVAAAHDAGIHQIDDLLITHYHMDHVGGVPQLAALIPIRKFIDHGQSVETRPNAEALYKAYLKVREKGRHILARPGMQIPIRGMRVTVLTAAGKDIEHSLPGGGEANPYCSAQEPARLDHSENAQSIGVLVSYGKFRMIDLGDLPSWPGEHGLVCPTNLVGQVEVYLTTQHAYAESGAAFLVNALRPIVVVANNGTHKGGASKAFEVIQHSPGLEGFWDLHYSDSADKNLNAQPSFIANPTASPDHGYWIKLTAHSDGTFTVTNQRNGESKTYHPRK
jgi:competence protein ComEC